MNKETVKILKEEIEEDVRIFYDEGKDCIFVCLPYYNMFNDDHSVVMRITEKDGKWWIDDMGNISEIFYETDLDIEKYKHKIDILASLFYIKKDGDLYKREMSSIDEILNDREENAKNGGRYKISNQALKQIFRFFEAICVLGNLKSVLEEV